MEENVRQELDALTQMVSNWKADYLGFATPEGGNEFLFEEFQEEITTYLSPYLRRLYQCEHLTREEAEEFMNYCYDQVDDLRRLVQELETPEVEVRLGGIWAGVIGKSKEVWRE